MKEMDLLILSCITSLPFISLGLEVSDENSDKIDTKWSYDSGSGLGPEKWSKSYPACSGRAQSPIDIVTKSLQYDPKLTYFNFSDYKMTSGVSLDLSNTGLTVTLAVAGNTVVLRGGDLPAEYNLIQLHFHWGTTSAVGSEHLIQGRQFPLELHLVHLVNSSQAQDSTRPLAVVGFLYEISAENNTKYDQLLKHFHEIKYPDEGQGQGHVTIQFPLIDLLPEETDRLDFYRYNGSLTTPPCTESVIWSVAMRHIQISEAQMSAFRNLYGVNNETYANTFRETQSINGRTIFVTTPTTGETSGHRQSHCTCLTILMLLLFVNLF